MAEEITGIPVAVEIHEAEGSQEESFDIPVIAVAEISEPEPEDITEESLDIPVIAVAEISEPEPEDITEESFDIPAIAVVNEPEGSDEEVIGDIIILKTRPKILSRYLLPSVGSCHDLCKYGAKHPFEGKPASRVLRKVKSAGGDGRDLRRTIVSLAKQNKQEISTKSSPEYNAQFSITDTDLKEDIICSPAIVALPPKRLLPSIKEVEAVAVHYSRTKLNLSQSKGSLYAGRGCSGTKRNKEVVKGKEQDGYGSSGSCTNRTSRCQEMDTSIDEDIKALVPQAVTWTPRNHVKRAAIADKKVMGRCRLKNQSHPIRIKPIQSNNEDVEEKTLYMIEPSSETETEGLAQNSVLTTDLSQPQSPSSTDHSLKHDQEADGTPKVPPLSVKKNVRRTRNGMGSKILYTSSLSRGFKGLRPKRFDMVSTQSSPSSPSSSRCPSEPVRGEHVGSTSGNNVKKSEYSKVKHKIEIRRMGLTDSENRDCQPRKLKFKKGRVVELQPENNSPRRLKFRRVRILGETQSPKSDSRKRSIQDKEANHNGGEAKETENSASRQQYQEFKRKKNVRRKEIIDGKFVSNRTKSERVILRHQDSKGRKEIQNLFNNVIEETASKLAQTRKSKVKALVGAFETVISLQDTRPSATVGA